MHYFIDERIDVYFEHCLIPDPANKEGLYQMTKYAKLKNEVVMWLDENIGAHNWNMDDDGVVIAFVTKEDAMAFMLRWS